MFTMCDCPGTLFLGGNGNLVPSVSVPEVWKCSRFLGTTGGDHHEPSLPQIDHNDFVKMHIESEEAALESSCILLCFFFQSLLPASCSAGSASLSNGTHGAIKEGGRRRRRRRRRRKGGRWRIQRRLLVNDWRIDDFGQVVGNENIPLEHRHVSSDDDESSTTSARSSTSSYLISHRRGMSAIRSASVPSSSSTGLSSATGRRSNSSATATASSHPPTAPAHQAATTSTDPATDSARIPTVSSLRHMAPAPASSQGSDAWPQSRPKAMAGIPAPPDQLNGDPFAIMTHSSASLPSSSSFLRHSQGSSQYWRMALIISTFVGVGGLMLCAANIFREGRVPLDGQIGGVAEVEVEVEEQEGEEGEIVEQVVTN
ncbi:hypothetical protein CBR_g45607 [Chara braunii]|uniref:Uncharacterized protein n=1 Tax=Chara braunii TaxID=69332 RepID=A0A388LZB5_CHABU|nr:hypothetical protein CBR_g45607 [Chara braunii]|eukprot:GBG87549.1 hypothetical protein CBR_g45607 [Chara braunii]